MTHHERVLISEQGQKIMLRLQEEFYNESFFIYLLNIQSNSLNNIQKGSSKHL